ncbi:ABC transporter substrate-binding protein [Rugamonas apoptosis]|uniref:ABC transporter substrate-binding protein n=1 Tax=Rugamonas apoptosis TaxID=2758570 RepID=A0A7W2F9D1_9BURK|nr:ABC transporter substrate-binding protein [Rugamonas apoptosis]MBA5687485.1 ABC transporter substrate-binding protein [Rugamonas apoptosis]
MTTATSAMSATSGTPRGPRRRAVLRVAAAGCAWLATPALRASQRPYRIYMMLYRGQSAVEQGFRDYFAVNGIPVELIVRDVAQDIGKVPQLVAEARARRADLIYTWGTPVTLAVAGRAGAIDPAIHVTDIPVVFTMVASPLGSGLVTSLSSSGRNVTGACHVVPLAQQLSAIRAYRRVERIAVIYNPAEPNSVQNVAEWRALASENHLRLVEKPVPPDAKGQPDAGALPRLVANLSSAATQLLYIGPDSFLAANRKALTMAALAQRLPTFAATEVYLRDGKALFGLVSGYESVGRLTAHKAAQILVHRMAPAAIPIETLARFSYLVNMSVADQLQLYPPLKVINYAELMR